MAAAPYLAYGVYRRSSLPQARQALRRRAIYRRHTRHFAGWRLRLTRPGVRAACHSFIHLRD
ncbi:hypothetical protein LNQ03_00840 [Klebsiella pneumoniae subsp. pneumoniae]|nr:hypothetical protein [Klebsiella pneumoniae subsp. pneumoniae]